MAFAREVADGVLAVDDVACLGESLVGGMVGATAGCEGDFDLGVAVVGRWGGRGCGFDEGCEGEEVVGWEVG